MLEHAPIIQVLGRHLLVQGPGKCLKGREQTGCAMMHISKTVTRLIRHYWPKCQEFDGCSEPGTHQCISGRLVCCKHAHRFGWMHSMESGPSFYSCICFYEPYAIAQGGACSISEEPPFQTWMKDMGKVLLSTHTEQIVCSAHVRSKMEPWDAIHVKFKGYHFAIAMNNDVIYLPRNMVPRSKINYVNGWQRAAILMQLAELLKRNMVAFHRNEQPRIKRAKKSR